MSQPLPVPPPAWRFHPRNGPTLDFLPADQAVETGRTLAWRQTWEREGPELLASLAPQGDWQLGALLDGLASCHLAGCVPATRAQIVEANADLRWKKIDLKTQNDKLRRLQGVLEEGGGVRLRVVLPDADYHLVGGRPWLKAKPAFHYLLEWEAPVSGVQVGPSAEEPQVDPAPAPRAARHRALLLGAALALAGGVAFLWLHQTASPPATVDLGFVPSPPTGAAVVVGRDAGGAPAWSLGMSGRPDGRVARWPDATEAPAAWMAAATPPVDPTEPGELALFDVRVPSRGVPPVSRLRLDGPRFLESPEPPTTGRATAYGFWDAALYEGGAVALAHDHLMAPAWILAVSFDGLIQARLFHPGHLERLALARREGRTRVVAAGVNNRLCLADPAALDDCPSTPVIVEIALPFSDGQLPPGCAAGLPAADARMWAVQPAGFRFHEVSAIPDSSGAVYLHGEDETQGDCWAVWHLLPDGVLEAHGVGPGCAAPPRARLVEPSEVGAACARLVGDGA